MKSKRFSLLSRLLLVPKCASCDERLSPFAEHHKLTHGYACLCDKCREAWQMAKSEMCHTCYLTADKCTCLPRGKGFSQPYIPSLFFYHPDKSKPQNKVIYSLKHKDNSELVGFLAKELSVRLERMLSENGVSAQACIFTWIPRKRASLIKDGFDQGERLCAALAAELGGKSYPLFVRVGGKEQKRLEKQERTANAESSVFLNYCMRGVRATDEIERIDEIFRGKTVVIIDDIITTGATLSRGISELMSSGASRVFVCCAARYEATTKKNRKQKDL